MDRIPGKYIDQKVSMEGFRAYVPDDLPPKFGLNLENLYQYLEQAMLAIAELNSVAKSVPNSNLFIYMHVRKEALLSSQIEGTQSSFLDLILFEHDQDLFVSLEDVKEVSSYVKAINYSINRVRSSFPLSLRLLKETHAVLLSNSRGFDKLPGEFRRSQNWIGGSKPQEALFVPPPINELDGCLASLERFFYNKKYPVLIKAALVHVQFETIHPFLDGNGRLGRLLIMLLLIDNNLLDEPVLYLSLYLKKNRAVYYDLLQGVRMRGDWNQWLEFFLKGVINSSKQAIKTINDINDLFSKDLQKISFLGRSRFSCEKVFDYLKLLPQATVALVAKELKITAPTARSALNALTELGVLEEISGKKRDKVYVYKKYLNILDIGAEPL